MIYTIETKKIDFRMIFDKWLKQETHEWETAGDGVGNGSNTDGSNADGSNVDGSNGNIPSIFII